ncbi:hypothetical protein HMPREF0239_01512 [Clostridium sp. ATCC BAA-442]|nr:hypothetical protein HMPREF0239_01512 [Clostridium sp. ATCC BAA-442]
MGPPSLLHPYLQTEKKISCIPPICSYLFFICDDRTNRFSSLCFIRSRSAILRRPSHVL